LQTWPLAQAFEQLPQWAGSEVSDTQLLPHSVRPDWHLQEPPWHCWPPVQVTPHPPQLLSSVDWSTHIPAHVSRPAGQPLEGAPVGLAQPNVEEARIAQANRRRPIGEASEVDAVRKVMVAPSGGGAPPAFEIARTTKAPAMGAPGRG